MIQKKIIYYMIPNFIFSNIINIIIKNVGFLVEYIGLIIIVFSVFTALIRLASRKYNMESVRVNLAQKIIFGLEFVIAADIVLATVTVSFMEIVQLGGIVLIRVLLGYSLRKEIIGQDPKRLLNKKKVNKSLDKK